VTIKDAARSRWEIPESLVPRPGVTEACADAADASGALPRCEYTVEVDADANAPFALRVKRSGAGASAAPLLDTTRFPLVFRDEYIQLGTSLPRTSTLYGLGESTRSAGLRLVAGTLYTLWARDTAAAVSDQNLYAARPFYVEVRADGTSHGVLYLSSNAMDVELGEDHLAFHATGGVVDLYVFTGPSPEAVVRQMAAVLGKPAMPPYWSLGFHQSKYGYQNVAELADVVSGYAAAGLPLEVLWSDIDYMSRWKDFTLNATAYNRDDLQALVARLHDSAQRYVMIVDPGILKEPGYPPYDEGLAKGVFVTESDGKTPFLGQVWPGVTAFPDFLNPATVEWWSAALAKFATAEVELDGVWIDMNEPSNFCNGQGGYCAPVPGEPCPGAQQTQCCLTCAPEPPGTAPPFAVNNGGQYDPLWVKTLAMSAMHPASGARHSDAHNLYGLSEAVATRRALEELRPTKRPFILTRSSFPGSGAHAAHWTGDNAASWDDLKWSIQGVLNSNLALIPQVGSDICGFIRDTTEELCTRWAQVGSFYPFSRNHGDIQSKRQEYFQWASVTAAAKASLELRYRLLPYLYTLHHTAHVDGATVARPLAFEFPASAAAVAADAKQFMLGGALLVSPALDPGVSSVHGALPGSETWWALPSLAPVAPTDEATFAAPLTGAPPVHLRSGYVVAEQEPLLTTAAARGSPFSLLVAFSLEERGGGGGGEEARGKLFLDDGESAPLAGAVVGFRAELARGGGGSVASRGASRDAGAARAQEPPLRSIAVLGVRSAPASVHVQVPAGEAPAPKWTFDNFVLRIDQLQLDITAPFNVTWLV